jgi:exosortase E/protease (VPEID-CTERM system)
MSTIIAEPGSPSDVSSGPEEQSFDLSWKIWVFVSAMAIECATLTAMPHSFWIPSRTFLTMAIVFAVALLFFGRSKLAGAGGGLGSHVPQNGRARVALPFIVLHLAALTVAIGLTRALMRAYLAGQANDPYRLIVWGIAILLLPASLAVALASARRILGLAQQLGSAWGVAAFCGVTLGLLRSVLVSAWDSRGAQLEHWLQTQTTRGVYAILRLMFSDVTADPATSMIATNHFAVIIGGVCSGIEGLAMVLVLTLSWLIYARKELRLDRAWLLVPASMVVIWTLNIVRLVALIAIGDAGHPEIAMGGFHSEGGWIVLNIVAFGFLLTVERVNWFRRTAIVQRTSRAVEQPPIVVHREAKIEGNSLNLSWRIWTFAGVLGLEFIALSGLPHEFWVPVRWFTTAAVVFCVAIVFFGRSKLTAPAGVSGQPTKSPTSQFVAALPFLALHLAALAVIVTTNLALTRAHLAGQANNPFRLIAWLTGIALLPVSVAGALSSPSKLVARARTLGSAWGIASACAVVTGLSQSVLRNVWEAPGGRLTEWLQIHAFHGVVAVLRLFYRGVEADPTIAAVSTRNFEVVIGGKCSGIEGLALVLVLTLSWLIYARKELRLDRAWLLVPGSLLLMWTLNIVRLAALVAIGDAGYVDIAMGGFHSEAGWILFNVVALGFLLTVERVQWFRKATVGGAVRGAAAFPAVTAEGARDERNIAAIYLLPFLAMLACALLSRAASDGGAFDALYPIRLVVVAAAIWAYRKEYRKIDWSFGWLGPVAGLGVFAFWLAFQQWTDRAAVVNSGAGLAAGLAHLGYWHRMGWLASRCVSATIMVPFAEELAFRGFLARRIMSADVESVSLRRLSVLAMVVSSVVFGLMHGKMWIAGALAGLVFALVAKRRGKLGEAFAAHAVANLAIAVWVLTRGDYSMW